MLKTRIFRIRPIEALIVIVALGLSSCAGQGQIATPPYPAPATSGSSFATPPYPAPPTLGSSLSTASPAYPPPPSAGPILSTMTPGGPQATVTPTTGSPLPTTLPTYTPTPAITLTPTPLFLVETGTPLPDILQPIAPDNAGRVSGLAGFRERSVTDLAWGPDGRTLAIATYYGIQMYDAPNRLFLRSLHPVGAGVVDLAFSPSGRWLVAGSRVGTEQTSYGSNIELWMGPDWKPMGIIYGEQRGLTGLAFAPGLPYFAAGFTGLEPKQDGEVYLWDLATWAISTTLKTGTTLSLAFSPDGRFLATTPDRYSVQVWDMKDMGLVYTLRTSFTGAANCLVFAPDSNTLATGHYDGTIRLWNMANGEAVKEMLTDGVVESLTFSPDGRILASGNSYDTASIQLWGMPGGELLRTLSGHEHGVEALAFSAGGTMLASGSFDGMVRLWGLRP